jgi:hypothetical protein
MEYKVTFGRRKWLESAYLDGAILKAGCVSCHNNSFAAMAVGLSSVVMKGSPPGD